MNILYLPSWYPNEENPISGIFIKRQAQAANLYNRIIVLAIYSLPLNLYLKTKKFLPEHIIENGIYTIRFRYPRVFKIGYISQFIFSFFLFLKIKNKFKIKLIHSHIVLPCGFISVVLGKLFNVPVVLSEHTGPFSRQMTNCLKRFLVKQTMRYLKRVIVVSDSLKREIESFKIKGNFIKIENVVDTNIFKPTKIIKREGNHIKILTITSLIPQKGIEYLLKAVNILREKYDNFVLDIIGDGLYREYYENLTFRLGLKDKVKFHGLIILEKRIVEFLVSCDFYVSASLSETFGVNLIEAMACGKPVVATDCGGPSEFVIPETGILVKPGDTVALSKGIEYMLSNYKKFSSERIRSYIVKKFSNKVIGKKLNLIYKEFN